MDGKVNEKFCPHCGKQFSSDVEFCEAHGTHLLDVGVDDDLTGTTLNGKYVLIKLLGKGAFGSVYQALHLLAKTKVAVKVLHAHLQEENKIRKQFLKEARVVMELKSPHVVRVFDVDEDELGRLYIVMELMEGMTLKEYVGIVAGSDRRMPVDQIVFLALQICEALDEAHDVGVIHRDLKPSNVMVLRDRKDNLTAKVVDFGIAHLARVSEEGLTVTETSAGGLVGTPSYMSPEQCMGRDTDPRSDLYGLGVILYELFSGRRPFKTNTAQEMLIAHATRVPEPPDLSATEIRETSGIRELIMKLLEKEPDKRFQSAEEVTEALEGLNVIHLEDGDKHGTGTSGRKLNPIYFVIPVVVAALALAVWAMVPGSAESPRESDVVSSTPVSPDTGAVIEDNEDAVQAGPAAVAAPSKAAPVAEPDVKPSPEVEEPAVAPRKDPVVNDKDPTVKKSPKPKNKKAKKRKETTRAAASGPDKQEPGKETRVKEPPETKQATPTAKPEQPIEKEKKMEEPAEPDRERTPADIERELNDSVIAPAMERFRRGSDSRH